MSNAIKYNAGSESNVLRRGNFYIGTRDVPKGPTSQTGYYAGLTPPSVGYTVYINKSSGGPAVYVADSDSDLISLTNKIAGTSYSTISDALNYYSTQTDKMVLNRDYPPIVTDDLILYLDAGNVSSYPRSTSLLDVSSNLKPTKNSTFLNMSNWALGSGGVTGYSQNGLTSENERVMGTDPWGNSTIVWEARPSGDNGADGGWNTEYYSIDKTKLYRFSVWVKRTSDTGGGTSYLGLYDCVNRLDGGGTQCNPYWECASTSTYTKDVWYLLVGHCYPYGTTGIANNKHPDSGRYTVNGRDGDLNYCNLGGDVAWLSDATQTLHRTYLYYCNDNTTRLQWFDPRIDLCDGTEPTIDELLKKPISASLQNGVGWDALNGGSLIFDGTNDYVTIGKVVNLGTSDFTLSTWVYIPSGTSNTFKAIINKKGASGSEAGYGIYYNTGMQKFLWSTANGSSASEVFTANTFAYIEDTWAHVVMIRKNGDTNNGGYYVNGVYQGLSSSGTILNVDNSYNLSLGIAAANYTPYCFEGKISNVQIYNRALANSEIISNYLSLLPRFTGQDIVTNGLVLYLDAGYPGSFKNPSSIWYDISGRGNYGTLTNGAAYSSLDGGSISFDGIDDHIVMSLPTAISVYCLEMVWYNNNAIPNNDTPIGGPSTYQTPIEFNGNGTGVHLGAWTGSLTNEAIHIWSGSGATSNRVSAGVGYHHVVFNWNGTTYDIWLDGVKTPAYYLGGYLPANFITATSIKIGTDVNNYSFNGRIPVTKIYNRTLSDNEISKNYLNYETRFSI